MPKSKTLAALLLVVSALAVAVHAQTPQLLKKTTTKTDKLDFGAGGTIAIAGAPNGSITIVGSSKNEIEITAEIEVQAMNEADMARLASVTDFITQESTGRFGVITVGTQNRVGDKSFGKISPKIYWTCPIKSIIRSRYLAIPTSRSTAARAISTSQGSTEH
ncbi:MAG: hypothetical protein IPJ55_10535 [Chloracidobacterium sp.]|nr:hypothetical protein [Chloracidobacterium sp.]